jgi:anti-sigma regulatory factor (Ser/Thr protein kinase)
VPSVELPADRTAPSRARRFVSSTLQASNVPPPVIDDAVLLASELVTNALLHARSAPRLDLVLDGAGLRCTVDDDSVVPPRRRHYDNDAATGRGLALVESLAARWGSEATAHGKRVWFEMDYEPDALRSRPRTTRSHR